VRPAMRTRTSANARDDRLLVLDIEDKRRESLATSALKSLGVRRFLMLVETHQPAPIST